MFRTGLILLGLLFVGTASGESFYKWVDENGVTQYSATPPPDGKARTIDVELKPALVAPPAESKRESTSRQSRDVVIYTADWCGVCKKAKQYFKSHQVAYTEYDVEKSAKGSADFKRMNGRGVPVVLVGEARMDGFDPRRFEQMMSGR